MSASILLGVLNPVKLGVCGKCAIVKSSPCAELYALLTNRQDGAEAKCIPRAMWMRTAVWISLP